MGPNSGPRPLPRDPGSLRARRTVTVSGCRAGPHLDRLRDPRTAVAHVVPRVVTRVVAHVVTEVVGAHRRRAILEESRAILEESTRPSVAQPEGGEW